MPDSPPEDLVDGAPLDTAPVHSDVIASEPSPDKPAESLLDAVKAATKQGDVSPASEAPEPQAEGADQDTKTEPETPLADDGELSPEEKKALSAKTKERIEKLVRDGKQLRSEAERLAPKAAEFDKIDTAIRGAGLSYPEVADLLQIGVALKNDPQHFLALALPVVARVQEMVGAVLPSDLQERVRLGHISQEDAGRLARAEAGERLQRSRSEVVQRATAEQHRAAQELALYDRAVSSIESWDAAKAKSDPDWSVKRTLVAEKVETVILRKAQTSGGRYIPSPEEAVRLAEDALKEVEGQLRAFAPKPHAVKPAASAGASPRSAPEPKTMLEAMKQAIPA